MELHRVFDVVEYHDIQQPNGESKINFKTLKFSEFIKESWNELKNFYLSIL